MAAALFLLGSWQGVRVVERFEAEGRKPFYYQSYFEPAVMLACGRGFVVTDTRPQPLDDFLDQRVDRFDCAAVSGVTTGTKNVYQYGWYYLMITVGLAWKVLGVSWSGLAPLFGVLFGTVIVLSYALFRIAAPPVLALAPSLALTASSLHSRNLPHLRDYSKAPFVLALILLTVLLVSRPMGRRALLGTAALFGALLGIGYGFRSDLLANIPPFVVTVLLFLPGGVTRNPGVKAAMLGLAAAGFIITAWPVASFVAARGGCQWHVALLGLDGRYSEDMGVASSFYQWQGTDADEFVATTVGSYRNRLLAPGTMEYCSADYDRVSKAYFLEIVRRAPADLITRAHASILRILDLPLYWSSAASAGVDESAFSWWRRLLGHVSGGVAVAALASVVLLGARSSRLGAFALLFVLYFGAYPSIQFSNRHFFHLEFIGWWAVTFLVWQGLRFWRPRGDSLILVQERDWTRLVFTGARFALVAVIAVVVPVPVTRAYQDRQIEAMTQALLDAPREAVPVSRPIDGFLKVNLDDGIADPMRTAYLDLHLDAASCGEGFSVGLRYATPDALYDFSGPVRFLPTGTFPARILVPVYRFFDGVVITGAPGDCVSRLDRVVLGPLTPVLPVLTLPADWQDRALHHELKPPRWVVAPFRWPARTDG